MTCFDKNTGVYRTFCDISNHYVIKSHLDRRRRFQKKNGKSGRLETPGQKKPSHKTKIQINIIKNLKKSCLNQSAEIPHLDSFSNPTEESKEKELLIPLHCKKKLSFKKSVQNCESSNLLSVSRNQEENLTRRSKTEDDVQLFFPDTIEDIHVDQPNPGGSNFDSYNIFHNPSNQSSSLTRLSLSKSILFEVPPF